MRLSRNDPTWTKNPVIVVHGDSDNPDDKIVPAFTKGVVLREDDENPNLYEVDFGPHHQVWWVSGVDLLMEAN